MAQVGLNPPVTPRPSAARKTADAANQIAVNMLWQAFNAVAVYDYVAYHGVSAVQLSTGLIVYGVLNALFNLVAGHVSDRTRTRFGRRIPYVAIASVPYAVCFALLFSPPHLGETGLVAYFLGMTFLFDLSFTFTALNANALYPEMYPDPRDRAFVSALQQVFGIVGLIAGVALSKSFGQSLGWSRMAWLFAGVAIASLYVSLWGSFESKDPAPPFSWGQALRETFRNRAFIWYVIASFLVQFTTTLFTTASSFYTTYVVRLSPLQNSIFLGGIFIVAMPVAFVWARAALRYSASRAAMAAIVLYACVEALLLVDRSPASVLVTGLLLGVPVAGFMVLLNMLLAEVIDLDARWTGRRREGMYLGVNGCIVRLGLSLQYAVMAVFFALSGYRAGASAQPPSAVEGFRILLGLVPAAFLAAAFVCMRVYDRTRPH
ncbi:MFS transporter [Alicyclobacillus vulcanalis]|uniref:Glycoside/pentoside/hexuronide:cation symporter, GPH family n=1 Tax=Alicyclobacillus vulcanalis TaxID=252246 RepID=A0A1N7L2H1_9BACL|nr:MFS transporter [Alicyclobacillus vulcanalis]SIS67946.1 glycoside/pentoside/hexuronide:cation symporter, GPH family [Alicyclobacillus vulcanalis]